MAPKKRDAKSAGAKENAGGSPSKRFRLNPTAQGSRTAIDLDEEDAAAAKSMPKAKASSAKSDKAKAMPKELPKVSASKPRLPLEGITMVFTGEMDQITRHECEEKAKAAGAKVQGNVSGNVQYLVVGSRLDDGRAVEETGKYRKMMELKEKGKKHPEVLTEAQFLEKLPDAPAARQPVVRLPVESQNAATASSASSTRNWVDRWAPRNFEDLIGNASTVRKLTEWLRDWDDVVFKGKQKKAPFKPGGGMPENINARAALISGPPGIGKTTTCRLVAQLHGGYEVLEYNASDSRGQKIIQEMALGIADNRTLSFQKDAAKKVPALTKKAVIIMDEVDGMGAGDRGGMAALNRMIKKTRNPIICICNDSHSPKVRSLAFSCYDLKFTRPARGTIAKRCAQIAANEGLQVEENALEELAESCGSDMRMVLNQLQMMTKSETCMTQGVNYMDMKAKIRQMNKDQEIMLSTFDACKKLLNSSASEKLSYRDRLEMFFVDHSIMGLMVHENYLNSVSKKPVDLALINKCAQSADLMAVGDMIGGRIRDNQEWSLLPDLGLFSAVYPAYVTNGFVGFPSFPAFLGKYSTQSRMRRLATELQTHLRLSSTASRSSLMTSPYSDLLYEKLIRPLLSSDAVEPAEAVKPTVNLLDAYGLRKEHFIEHLTELRVHLGCPDRFKEVDTKVKAAMTREFNTGGHAVKVVIPSAGKKRKASAEENPDEVGDDVEKDKVKAEPEEEKDSDDDAANSTLIKIGKGGKAKAKAKAKSKAETSSKGEVKPKSKAKAEAAPKTKENDFTRPAKAKAKGRAKR